MLKFEENTPIYLQIVQKIKADIVSGKIKGGDKIPSVRELSENFKVNPNTVQRVFQELEREGITYSQRGIGTFVTEGYEIMLLFTVKFKKDRFSAKPAENLSFFILIFLHHNER